MSQRSTYDNFVFYGPGRNVPFVGGGATQNPGVYQGSDLKCIAEPLRPRSTVDYPTRNFGSLRNIGSGSTRLIRAEISIRPYQDYLSSWGFGDWGTECVELWGIRVAGTTDARSVLLGAFEPGTTVCDIEVPPAYPMLLARYVANAPTWFFAGALIADGTYSRAAVGATFGFESIA